MMRALFTAIVWLFFAAFVLSQEGANPAIIRIERTRCYGPCPIYSAVIYKDGKVEYHGVEFVRVKGTCVSHVSTNDLRSILREVSSEKFLALRSSYGPAGTDAPSTSLTVNVSGRTKVVTDYTAEQQVVQRAADVIELNTAIHKWVGSRDRGQLQANQGSALTCETAEFGL